MINQWSGANDFAFSARRSELASNHREDHEISMLALHLLQNCMVYVNLLMLQQILGQPQWASRLSPWDLGALTPLIWEHVNPYSRFELDTKRQAAHRLSQMAPGNTAVGAAPNSAMDEAPPEFPTRR
jgi:hypothetical protein